jgi:hypothetical protein
VLAGQHRGPARAAHDVLRAPDAEALARQAPAVGDVNSIHWVLRLEAMRRSDVQALRIIGECDGGGKGLECGWIRGLEKRRGDTPILQCLTGHHWLIMRGTVTQCLESARYIAPRYGPDRRRSTKRENFRRLLWSAHHGRLFGAVNDEALMRWLIEDGFAEVDGLAHSLGFTGAQGFVLKLTEKGRHELESDDP